MKATLLVALVGSIGLNGCANGKQEPEVAYRHCMAKYARELSRPTYKQVEAFSHNCDSLALEAAAVRAKRELGARYDAKSAETVSTIREKRQMIVQAHVCAFSSDRPVPPCHPLM